MYSYLQYEDAHLHTDKHAILHQNGMFICLKMCIFYRNINMQFHTKKFASILSTAIVQPLLNYFQCKTKE